jgi:dihydropteroate synthase
MGILNVTPDSFSDGGSYESVDAAIAAGTKMLADGADILDIGGESTRPNAPLVPVDTRNATTMAAALDAGARIINDVSGLKHDPAARDVVAVQKCPVVLMHMRGTPMTMNCQAHYADLVGDVLDELAATRDAAVATGILPENIALDPGLGFAKLGAQNILLLQATKRFLALGHPLLIGLSRKKFIGEFGGEAVAQKRGPGSLAAGLYAVAQGAHILRVHDVPETVQALKLWTRLTAEGDG